MLLVLTCLVVALGWAGSASAVTSVSSQGYSVRVWQTEDGLPQNTVTAITQTRDGYLWVGTLAGLARFDGDRFVTFDAGSATSLSDSVVSALYEARDGTLWIGHESGLVTRYRDGRFTSLPGVPGARTRVVALGEDSTGALWLLRMTGALERVGTPGAPESGYQLTRFARNAAGEIRVSVNGDLRELRAGVAQPVDLGPAQRSGYVRGLGVASDGSWWLVHDGRIRKRVGENWVEDRGAWGGTEINRLIECRDGSLALATMDDGVHLVQADGRTTVLNHVTVGTPNWVRVVFEDREGTLWFGAGTGGLAAVRRTPITVLNAPDNWQGRSVLATVAAPDGSLWVGTEGAGVYHYRAGAWRRFGMEEGIGNPFVWSLGIDRQGRVWAGTWGGGLHFLEGERFEKIPDPALTDLPLFSLRLDAAADTWWVGTSKGIRDLRGGRSEWRPEPALVGQKILAMVEDSAGDVWVAMAEGGLAHLSRGKVRVYDQRDGLKGRSVQAVLPDGDVVWFGTDEGGLGRLKGGRVVMLDLRNGIPSRAVCHVAADGPDYLWLSTHHGLFHVAKASLNRCADGLTATVSGQLYDKNDGLPTLEFSGGFQAAGCRTPDGRQWFPTSKGLVGVDPAAIRPNEVPPALVIESLRVDGQVYSGTSGVARAALGPGHQRLEFQFTALSFAAPNKIQFKYRLVGLDQDWIEAGAKRTASYSQLPAGEYRFEMIAANNDGLWNLQPVAFALTVAPFYWQTWWFRTGAAALAAALVGAAVRHETRRRLQRRVEELERERGLERERARIAQDIHDDIGSSLTRIAMLSQSVRQEAGQPYGAVPVLERIHDTAVEVTHTLDEIVWALNPRHDTLDSLVSYLARFAQDRLQEASLACRLNLPLNLPAWPLSTQVRHNLLLAFKEALTNLIRHSGATAVQLSLELRPQEFVFALEDNGAGFDPARMSGESAGNGLRNLRERLTQIGGHCEISSLPGKGTRVAFTVRLAAVPTPQPADADRRGS